MGDHKIGDVIRSSNNIKDGVDMMMMKEQDMLLPIANVGRIMKQILPGNAKISKEAKETMQECASEFISFVTSEASDKCKKERRKTVNGDDVCWALGALGFDDFSGPLKRYLDRYRELEGDRSSSISSNQEINKIYTTTSTSEEKDQEAEPSTNNSNSYGIIRSSFISTTGEASSSANRSKTVQNSYTHTRF